MNFSKLVKSKETVFQPVSAAIQLSLPNEDANFRHVGFVAFMIKKVWSDMS